MVFQIVLINLFSICLLCLAKLSQLLLINKSFLLLLLLLLIDNIQRSTCTINNRIIFVSILVGMRSQL